MEEHGRERRHDPATGELPALSPDESGGPPRPRRFRRFRLTLKLLLILVVVYLAWSIVVPGVRKALAELRDVNPILLAVGFTLEMAALYSYSVLTQAALGHGNSHISAWRMFRIQMSTKALSSIVPGGSAAGSALAYRLMTLSGAHGPDAGFALATAGIGSAVVLNLIFWASLIVSIPVRGVNAAYATGAIAGVIVMGFAAVLVFGLLEGQGRAERVLRWIARKLRMDEDRAAAAVRHIGGRLEDLAGDRQLLRRVVGWAAANWLLDAAALWVFLRAFGESTDLDALLVAFGLVNVLAVIPITPGGLGIIEFALPSTLVGFGLSSSTAVLGVATWRLAQFFFPIVLGGLLYGSLRVGPWSIERREQLRKLREIAVDEAENVETPLDFAVRFGRRRTDVPGPIRPDLADAPMHGRRRTDAPNAPEPPNAPDAADAADAPDAPDDLRRRREASRGDEDLTDLA